MYTPTELHDSVFIIRVGNHEESDGFYLTEISLHEVNLAYAPELLLKNVNLKPIKTVYK